MSTVKFHNSRARVYKLRVDAGTRFYDHDGSLLIKARLPAQVGALFMKAIDKAVEDLWQTEPQAAEANTPAGTPNVKFLPTRTKRADALELLAESFLQNGAAS